MFDKIFGVVSGVMDAVLFFFPTSPFQSFNATFDIENYLGYINWFVPFDNASFIGERWLVGIIAWKVYGSLIKSTKGKIIDSIIIGIICFIGTSIIGTPYPILISVVIGITNVIPFFGPYLGAIPCSILILMINPIHCLYFIIFILFLQQFDGNVLGPKILGDSTGLSSFWVIFAITFFGGIFGIFGMFIGVPTFAVIYAAIKSLTNKMLRKKGLKENTDKYLKVLEIKNSQYIDIENNNQTVKEISFKK